MSALSVPVPAFFAASEMAVGVVGSAPVADRWEVDSAVEGFTVGGLVAHVYSAIRLLESALQRPEPDSPRVRVGIPEFYGLNRVDNRDRLEDGFHAALRADAEKRAGRGPADLASRFEELIDRLRCTLSAEPMTRLVPVWRIAGGATPLADYLLTRVVELVVHADDLAVSAGMEVDVPGEAASAAFAVFLELARERSGDVAVLRSFARRERGDPEVLRVL
jgi:uncharacterized protein (TIGR03083 family)